MKTGQHTRHRMAYRGIILIMMRLLCMHSDNAKANNMHIAANAVIEDSSSDNPECEPDSINDNRDDNANSIVGIAVYTSRPRMVIRPCMAKNTPLSLSVIYCEHPNIAAIVISIASMPRSGKSCVSA